MTTDQPSFFDHEPDGYRRQLSQQLNTELGAVYRHAAGATPEHPWDFEAALVAVKWIADELRRLGPGEDAIPF